MADIHLERQHGMNLAQARKTAIKWAEHAEAKFDMECTYQEGDGSDELCFKRSGVTGNLIVTDKTFVLKAKLGFLLGAFKDKIESEIVKNLDTLIAKQAAAKTAAPKPAAKKPAVKKA